MASTSLLDKSRFQRASPVKVVEKLAEFAGKPVDQWLSQGHPGQSGQLEDLAKKAVIKNLKRARECYTDEQLLELTAAAGPNHCIDGWGFLGCALDALLRRDLHACRHLAYYAQLRAALSILSSAGIGIFNQVHVVIDNHGTVNKLEDDKENKSGCGTHKIVWPALQEWAATEQGAEIFLRTLVIGKSTLLDSFQAIWPSRAIVSVAAPIAYQWSLDLKAGEAHHRRRNISSYAPQLLNPLKLVLHDDVTFVETVWKLLEPSSNAGFQALDAHIMKNLFHKLHEQDNDLLRESGKATIPVRDSEFIVHHGKLDAYVAQLVNREFLVGVDNEYASFFRASQEDGDDPKSMIARAVLLLRSATACVCNSFQEAGVSTAALELREWLSPFLEARGLASSNFQDAPMADLWEDVKAGLQDMKLALESSNNNVHSFLSAQENGLPVVTQIERAAMWGLAP